MKEVIGYGRRETAVLHVMPGLYAVYPNAPVHDRVQ